MACPGYVREVRFKPYSMTRKRDHSSSASPGTVIFSSSDEEMKVRSLGSSSICKTCLTPTKPDTVTSPPMFNAINPPLQDRAVSLLWSSFAYSADANRNETVFFDFVLQMYQDAAQNSSIACTVIAVAHLNFMNRHKTGELLGRVNVSYGRALQRTNHALSKPESAYTDATLASVYLLSMFELLVAGTDPKAWSAHNDGKHIVFSCTYTRRVALRIRYLELVCIVYLIIITESHPIWLHDGRALTHILAGAMALLVSRGIEQFNTQQGVQLFRLVHTTTLINMIIDGRPPPEQLLSMIAIVLKAPPPHRKEELLVSKQLHMLTDMLARRNGPSLAVLDAQQAFEQAAWENDAWRPQIVSNAGATHQHLSQRYRFASGFILSNWVSHWASVILLCQTAIAQHSLCAASSVFSNRAQMLAEIDVSAAKILQSVGSALGKVDRSSLRSTSSNEGGHVGSAIGPTHLLFPLGVIQACPYVSDQHKDFAYNALQHIGHTFKVTRALRMVE